MTYIKLLMTAFFWGGTFIAGKKLAGHVDPYCAAFLRFAIASFFLVGLTLKTQGRLPKINRRQAVIIFFPAFWAYLPTICFFSPA